jgi:hypothetical protein
MAETLPFRLVHKYDLAVPGITVPVQLGLRDASVDFAAKVDTGASNCIFARMHGERLGIDIESGVRQEFGTATGHFIAYGHRVTLSVLGITFDTTAYFAAAEDFTRNVLGRQGWLDRIRLGLIDYEGKLYLSDYNDVFP